MVQLPQNIPAFCTIFRLAFWSINNFFKFCLSQDLYYSIATLELRSCDSGLLTKTFAGKWTPKNKT